MRKALKGFSLSILDGCKTAKEKKYGKQNNHSVILDKIMDT